MPRRALLALVCGLGALFLGAGSGTAQEASWREDLQFVESLRARNDSDLALEFLNRMAKNAPPELLKELPLEFAKTRLQVASEEPESGKRLELYRQARDDFQKFIKANPGHPRTAEANLDIARVLNLQGKTELARAQLNPDAKGKQDDVLRARATLEEGGKQLAAALAAMEEQHKKLPAPETVTEPLARKKVQEDVKRIENDILQTKLERALNTYDQMLTYGFKEGSSLLQDTIKQLQPLIGESPNNPITWKARAWLGRAIVYSETAEKGRAHLQAVLAPTNPPAANEGRRLARYFRMLVIEEFPTDEEKKNQDGVLVDIAERWLADYPNYRKSPEGYGVTYMLAKLYLKQAYNPKVAKVQQDRFLVLARNLLKDVEASENEFTDRARQLKITTMEKQGAFIKKVEALTTFEDCYVRSQYELFQMGNDGKTITDEKKLEEKRKERVNTVIAALTRGLSLPDAKRSKATLELNTARSTLAYWSLTAGKYKEAIAVGESFAREDPRSSQAAMASVYALEAYAKVIAQKQGAFDESVADDRAAMLRLAQYMEERWPRELPGDMARYQIGWQLVREANYPEAIKKLSTVAPNSSTYAFAQFHLADCALQADKLPPIAGDRPGDYRRRALQALERIPEAALGTDPAVNHLVVMGKCRLGREMYRVKRYQDMDNLADRLVKRLPELKFSPDATKDEAIRNQLRYELIDVDLFARYGLADAAYAQGDHGQVVKLLDPLVDAVNKPGEPQEKVNMQKNLQLSTAMLSLALRSNLLLGKVDRTDLVLDALDKVQSGQGMAEANSTNILKLLAALIRNQVEELRKKGDKEAFTKATTGYTAVLDKRIKKQKAMTNDFILVLADCYSSMEQHEKAASVLGNVPDAKAAAGSPEDRQYRAIQLLYARELRLSKTEESLKKATEVIDAIRGEGPPAPRAKWGWGRTNLDAIKEYGQLLEAKGLYKEAFAQWLPVVKQLVGQVQSSARAKDAYLECYYHMVYCYYKNGLTLSDQTMRDKAILEAARQIVTLEKSYEDFGGDASEKRFRELLALEPALREQYETLKKGGK